MSYRRTRREEILPAPILGRQFPSLGWSTSSPVVLSDTMSSEKEAQPGASHLPGTDRRMRLRI